MLEFKRDSVGKKRNKDHSGIAIRGLQGKISTHRSLTVKYT